MCPDARLISRPGMKNGDILLGPLSLKIIAASSIPCNPPIPDPISTPDLISLS